MCVCMCACVCVCVCVCRSPLKTLQPTSGSWSGSLLVSGPAVCGRLRKTMATETIKEQEWRRPGTGASLR